MCISASVRESEYNSIQQTLSNETRRLVDWAGAAKAREAEAATRVRVVAASAREKEAAVLAKMNRTPHEQPATGSSPEQPRYG